MTSSAPISPDSPEFRLLADLAGVKPSAVAAALNDPNHFSKYMSADELSRYVSGALRVGKLGVRIYEILDTNVKRTLKANPELRRRLKAKGLTY